MFKETFEAIKPYLTPWWMALGVFGALFIHCMVFGFSGLLTPDQTGWGFLIAIFTLFVAHGYRCMYRIQKDSTLTWQAMANELRLCKNELYQGKTLLVAPGDITDKLTILNLKKQIVKDKEKQELIEQERIRAYLLFKNILSHHKDKETRQEHDKLFKDLYRINRRQWRWEDKVRQEKSGEAAYEARMCNNERVKVKNQINRLFGFPTETKEYKQ